MPDDDTDERFADIVAERRDGTLAGGVAAVCCILLSIALYVWQGSFVATAAAVGLHLWVAPVSTALLVAGGVLGGLALWERMTGPRRVRSEERRSRGARRMLWVGLVLVGVFAAWEVLNFVVVMSHVSGSPMEVSSWWGLVAMWVPTVALHMGLVLVALSLWSRWSTSLP